MEYAKQKAILDATLRRPTAAHLSESEAHDRIQCIRENANFARETTLSTTPAGPAGMAFTRDWQNMMERERDYN